MSTRLSPAAYLDHLRADGARLSALGRVVDLARPVPTCPGWTMGDLVGHCGEVYAHKNAVLRLGRAPQDDEREPAPAGPGVVDYHDAQLAALAATLEALGPDAPTWTWFPGQKTTGFWIRRMANEAMIHRVDAELTAGEPAGRLDAVLAADGVGEVLGFAGHPGVLAHSGATVGASGQVFVDAGDHAFVVELPDDGHSVHEVDPHEHAGAGTDAVIRGGAGDLDLLFWGRPPGGAVREEGRADVLERLYGRLHLAVSD